jgi:transcriptional regulator with XRE-family HTH domain
MSKPLHDTQYKAMLQLLRALRNDVGVSQEQLAALVGETQSVVSKTESGIRRLDVIELRLWVEALGTPFTEFAQRLDAHLKHVTDVGHRLGIGRRRNHK